MKIKLEFTSSFLKEPAKGYKEDASNDLLQINKCCKSDSSNVKGGLAVGAVSAGVESPQFSFNAAAIR